MVRGKHVNPIDAHIMGDYLGKGFSHKKLDDQIYRDVLSLEEKILKAVKGKYIQNDVNDAAIVFNYEKSRNMNDFLKRDFTPQLEGYDLYKIAYTLFSKSTGKKNIFGGRRRRKSNKRKSNKRKSNKRKTRKQRKNTRRK